MISGPPLFQPKKMSQSDEAMFLSLANRCSSIVQNGKVIRWRIFATRLAKFEYNYVFYIVLSLPLEIRRLSDANTAYFHALLQCISLRKNKRHSSSDCINSFDSWKHVIAICEGLCW
jgi:hypothetical protein